MFVRKAFFKLIIIIFLIISVNSLFSVNYTWDAGANGDWETAVNWDPDGVPNFDDDTALIDTAVTVTVNVSRRIGELTINNAGAILNINCGNFWVYDDAGHSGDINVLAGTLAITYGGTNQLVVRGNFINNGTFTHSDNNSLFFTDNNTQTFDPGGSNFYYVEIDKSGNTINLLGPLTVQFNLYIAEGTFNIGNYDLIVTWDVQIDPGQTLISTGGDITCGDDWLNNGTFTHGNNTVTLNGINGMTPEISGSNFYNLIINNGAKTWLVNGNITVENDLTITAGTLDMDGNALDVDHDITGAGALTSGGGNINVGEDWGLTGTFNHNNNQVTFDGAGGAISPTTFYDLRIDSSSSGNEWVATGAIGTGHDCVINVGTLDINGNNLVVNSTFDINPNGVLQLQGGEGVTTPITNDGTVEYTGAAGPYNIKNWTYTNLIISGSGTFRTIADLIINGNLTQSNGTLDMDTSNFDIDLQGNFIFSNGTLNLTNQQMNIGGSWSNTTGNFIETGSTVVFDVAGSDTISYETFNNVNITEGTITLTGTFDVDGDLGLSGGTLDGSNRTIYVTGDWNNTGAAFTSTNSTVVFDGSSGTQEVTTNGQSYGYIQVSNNENRTIQLINDLIINNDFTFENGILDFNSGKDLTIGNDLNINGGTFTDSSSTGITSNTTITVGGDFTASATNAVINLLGEGTNHWILDVTGTGLASDNGYDMNASWSDASGGSTIACGDANSIVECINWDENNPYIVQVRACEGSNIVYIEFNKAVTNDYTTQAPPDENNFTYIDGNGTGATAISSITQIGAGQTQFNIVLNDNLTLEDIIQDRIVCDLNEIEDFAAKDLVNEGAQEYISYIENDVYSDDDNIYIGINFLNNIAYKDLNEQGDVFNVTDFDGDKEAYDENAIIDSHLNSTLLSSSSLRVFYDVFDNHSQSRYWLPSANTEARVANGINRGNDNWRFNIPSSDSEIKNQAELSFVFEVNTGAEVWYCYRIEGSQDEPQNNTETYMLYIRDLVLQNNDVSIYNNVINPRHGDEVRLTYALQKAGPVSIVVYDLNSNIIAVLKQGNQSKGTHTVSWDGRNENGKIVSRGVYFVRIRAPGIFNQIRKVLVIR